MAWVRTLAAVATLALVRALNSSAIDSCSGTLSCHPGCYDPEVDACRAGVSQLQCEGSSGTQWSLRCDCLCKVTVCSYGCWDTEDEECVSGISRQECAEIYGHVDWSARCECREVVYANGTAASEDAWELGTVPEGNAVFSVPAFVVMFREGLELVLLFVIIKQFLCKAQASGIINEETARKFRREMYWGTGLSFALCTVIGTVMLTLAALAFRGFRGNTRLIVMALTTLVTAFVMAFLGLNFLNLQRNMEVHELRLRFRLERSVQDTTERGEASVHFSRKHAFFVMAFSTGIREGLETILFLVGVVSDMKELKDLGALPLPFVTALLIARLFGCLFFYGTRRLRVAWFVRVSSAVLILMSAGFFITSIHFMQELAWFGVWSPRNRRGWLNRNVWDLSGCCSARANRFFVILNATFGWQDRPTALTVICYFAFLLTVAAFGGVALRLKRLKLTRELEELTAAGQPSGEQPDGTSGESEEKKPEATEAAARQEATA